MLLTKYWWPRHQTGTSGSSQVDTKATFQLPETWRLCLPGTRTSCVLSLDGLDLARHCGWMADGIAKLQDFAFEKKFPCSVQAELKLFASPLFQAPRWWDYRCAPTVEDTGSLFSGSSDSSNLVYVALGIGFPYWYKRILASKGDTSSKPQDEKTLILSFFGDRYYM